MLWMGLALAARIDVHDASSGKMIEALTTAADSGSESIRGCGWGWASMRVTVDGRGTTVAAGRGSSDAFIACVSKEVTSWDVMVLDGTAMIFVEANQERPESRKDREMKVVVLKVTGVEADALAPLIETHREAMYACQSMLPGDADHSEIKVKFGPRDDGYTAWAEVPGPFGRCVEREVEAWPLDESVSGEIKVEFGKEPSINSLLGP
jgi:hypothetical protein